MKRVQQLPPATQRLSGLGAAILLGALIGVIFAVGWGDNFRTKSMRVEGLGTFYRISLSNDIRELNDVRTAEIAAPDASDFERVGVNNYWIASSENNNRVLSPLPPNQVDVARTEQFVTDRHQGGELRGALNAYLPGRNFIVYEMENSSWGYCGGHFDVRLNGDSIAGVPLAAPSDPGEILSLLRIRQADGIPKVFHNVLCSRRIVQIDLGVRPEPLKRLFEFVGLAWHR